MNRKLKNNEMKKIRNTFILCLLFFSCSLKQDHNNHEQHLSEVSITQNENENPRIGKIIHSSQNTVKPTVSQVNSVLNLDGYFVPDERRSHKIAARVGGRIEKLYIKYPYQFVKKGEKILELYSPEMNTNIDEFLFLLAGNDTILTRKAREKLILLGMENAQIAELEKSKITPVTISIYSPFSGYIFPFAPSGTGSDKAAGNTGMNMDNRNTGKSTNASYPSTAEWLRQGMYLNKDESLFLVNDLEVLWGMAMARESEFVSIKINDSVSIKSEQNSELIMGRVNMIEPIYDQEQKYLRLRIYVNNPGQFLQVNSLFNAEIKINQEGESLLLPLSAVLDLGERKIVWLKTGNSENHFGLFKAIEIETGKMIGNQIEIKSGLSKDAEVAEQAGFMLDSETLIPY